MHAATTDARDRQSYSHGNVYAQLHTHALPKPGPGLDQEDLGLGRKRLGPRTSLRQQGRG